MLRKRNTHIKNMNSQTPNRRHVHLDTPIRKGSQLLFKFLTIDQKQKTQHWELPSINAKCKYSASGNCNSNMARTSSSRTSGSVSSTKMYRQASWTLIMLMIGAHPMGKLRIRDGPSE